MALAGLLPFLFIPVSWATVVQSKMLLLSVIAIVAAISWGHLSYTARTVVFPRSLLALSALALIAVYLISAIFSGAAPSSFFSGTGEQDTVVIIALFAAIFFVGALAYSTIEDAAASFFRPLILGGLVLMLIQIVHLFVPALTLGVLSGAATSVFGSWHEVGILAGLFIFLTVALFGTDVLAGVWRWAAIALSALSAVMLVVVNMIDVWYTFGGLLLCYALYVYLSRGKLGKVAVAIVIALISFGGAVGGHYVYEALPTKMQVLQVEVRPSWLGTFQIGKQSMDGIRTTILGSGPNTFTRQWSLYKPLGVNATEFWNVDFTTGVGFIPTTLVTVGALGLLAWVSIAFALLWTVVRRARHASQAEVALFGTAVYLAVFHVLYVPTVSLSALTFLALGVLAVGQGTRGPWTLSLSKTDIAGTVRTFVLLFAVLAVVVIGFFTIRAVASDLMVNKSAAVYNQTQDSAKALSLLQAAILVNGSNDRAHRAAVELGLIRLAEISASTGSADQARAELQVSIESAIQHGLAAVSINNTDYRNWLALAGLYRDLAGAGVQGAYENAQEAYEKALADNPSNPIPLVQMAQLEIAQNRIPDAVKLLDQAITLKPNFAAAYFLRSKAHSTLGNDELAINDAATVVQIAQEDPLSWFNLGTVLYDAEKYAEAAQALEQASALQADYANALFVLGLAYDKLGQSEEALAVFERIAEKNPGEEALQRIISNIKAGQPAMESVETQ